MKVVIWGGSSFSTPNLFHFFSNKLKLPEIEFLLLGRSEKHLTLIKRASNLLLEKKPEISVSLETIENINPVNLIDNEINLIQVRVGGFAGRSFDETFPLRYSICGDEGLGPGGLSAAWRNWPILEKFLSIINKYNPNSITIILTSPIGILTKLANIRFPNLSVIGICELPFTTIGNIAKETDILLENLKYDYFGINHLGWFFNLHSHRIKVMDKYLEAIEKRNNNVDFPTQNDVSNYRGIPLHYMRMGLHFDTVLHEQMGSSTRGKKLLEIKSNTFEMYRFGDRAKIVDTLKYRPAPWYEYAIGPLFLDFAGFSQGIPYFITQKNGKFLSNLHENDQIEVRCQINNKKLEPVALQNNPPKIIADLLSPYIKYERFASYAILNQDEIQIQTSLEKHPWVKNKKIASLLTYHILNQI